MRRQIHAASLSRMVCGTRAMLVCGARGLTARLAVRRMATGQPAMSEKPSAALVDGAAVGLGSGARAPSVTTAPHYFGSAAQQHAPLRIEHTLPSDIPMDYKAFSGLARLAIIGTGSFCLWLTLVGTLGYSAWWHYQLQEAVKAGRDPDEWFRDFDANHDPVSTRLRAWGWTN